MRILYVGNEDRIKESAIKDTETLRVFCNNALNALEVLKTN